MYGTSQEILDALVTRLQAVKTEWGFATDLGQAVTLNRNTPYSLEETLPACNIRNPEDRHLNYMVSGTELIENKELDIPVHIVVAPGQTPDTTVRTVAQDIITAIGADTTFGGLAITADVDVHELTTRHQRRRMAFGTIRIRILYRLKAWGDATVLSWPEFSDEFSLEFTS